MTRDIVSALPDPSDHRLLTEQGMRAIVERIQALQPPDTRIDIELTAWWRGDVRWARNRVAMASDRRDVDVHLTLWDAQSRAQGEVRTNQMDEASLRAALQLAERAMRRVSRYPDYWDGIRIAPPLLPFPDTAIWSDATYSLTPEQRGIIAQQLSVGAEAQQMMAAGYLQMRVHETMQYSTIEHAVAPRTQWNPDERHGEGVQRTARLAGYVRCTEAQCSMTVRHPKGVGSGWAGLSGYDWNVIDAKQLSELALQKCQQSLNPVAIEPGRYTVILEPQAVVGLVDDMIYQLNKRLGAESTHDPNAFKLGGDPAIGLVRTKLGMKIIDERLTIAHDPMEQRSGIMPVPGLGKITWFDRGVLTALSYGRDYAIPWLHGNLPAQPRGGFTISGGDTSMDEMIHTTKRGLLVTRFSNGRMVNTESILINRITRDGLWLIEDGKISKAVKNMRVTDSPLFAFNQVEQLGVPVPVFHPGEMDLPPAIVPPMKCRDFAFTATVDAV